MQYVDNEYGINYFDNGQQDLQNPLHGGSRLIGKNESFMKFLFDFKKEAIIPLRFIWRGYEYDTSKQEYVKSEELHPVMNEKGITWAMGYIESFINPIFVTSNYNEKFFNFNMRESSKVIWNTLCTRWKEFDMNKLDIPKIANEVETKIQAILLGARDNGFREFFTKQYHVSENITDQRQQKKNNILGTMSNMFKPKGGNSEIRY